MRKSNSFHNIHSHGCVSSLESDITASHINSKSHDTLDLARMRPKLMNISVERHKFVNCCVNQEKKSIRMM